MEMKDNEKDNEKSSRPKTTVEYKFQNERREIDPDI